MRPCTASCLKLFHICWRCASHKKSMIQLSDFLQLSECRWDFQGNKLRKQCSSAPGAISHLLLQALPGFPSPCRHKSSLTTLSSPLTFPAALHYCFSRTHIFLSDTPLSSLPLSSSTSFPPLPFSQQQPLSPCQLGASAWIPLLTEVTGVTYNYMAMDYGALVNIQILAFLKWQNIINSKFCLQWKFNGGGRPSLSFLCVEGKLERFMEGR